MDEAKEKFIFDWGTVFPGIPLPNLQFLANSETVENEITERLEKIQTLKLQLAQEEFVLDKLHEVQKLPAFSNESVNETVGEESITQPNTVIKNENINVNKDEDKGSYKAIWDTVPKVELSSSETQETVVVPKQETNQDFKPIWDSVPKPLNKASSFGDDDLPPPPNSNELKISNTPVSTKDVHLEKGATFNVEVLRTNTDYNAGKHKDNGDLKKPSPRNSFSTFQSSSGPSEKYSSQSSLNEMFLMESSHPDDDNVIIDPGDNFANIKTHRKSYSIDENVFDYSSPIPVSRRLTDPLPSKPMEEEKDKPKPAPRTLSRNKKDKPLPPLPKKPSFSETNTTSFDNETSKPQTKPSKSLPTSSAPPPIQQRSISEASSVYQDDEHIYSDISELNINRQRMDSLKIDESFSEDDSPVEQIYENSNMQPKLAPLVDNSSEPHFYHDDIARGLQRKRLGSHDRQGMALPDDMNVDNTSGASGNAVSLEEILIGSQESLVDEAEPEEIYKKPSIFIQKQLNESSDDDDDEHIYANVDDLHLYSKGSDDDSDHDPLGDSISLDIPSPHYTELTPAKIQSMLQKIQNNTSDHSQGKYFFIYLFLLLVQFANNS